MGIEDRGFASMSREKQREIASKGGRMAHLKGTAHEWTTEEARAAGRKGGMARHHSKQAATVGTNLDDQPVRPDIQDPLTPPPPLDPEVVQAPEAI